MVILFLLALILSLGVPENAFAAGRPAFNGFKAIDYLAGFEAIQYGKRDGLLSAETNAIVQTGDGYIWAGTYSGLYRFDGSSFERVADSYNINSVMTLFVDSRGRLWIGTNESGLGCYDPVVRNMTFYREENGLAADSIRSITEDDKGSVYVGTVEGLSKIDKDGNISEIQDPLLKTGVRSLCASEGSVIGVTNDGSLFLIKDDKVAAKTDCDVPGVDYTCVELVNGETILAGTSNAFIDRLEFDGDGIRRVGRYDTGNISYFSSIYYDSLSHEYFFGAENGMGVVEEESGEVISLAREGFESSVCQVTKDYQGNIWFVSNKQGILKLSPNPFTDVFVKAGIEGSVVNAIGYKGDDIYIGKDNGLSVVNKDSYKPCDYDFISEFDGVRIRHINIDSGGNVWLSTYGQEGLYRIDADGEVESFHEGSGTLGARFRYSTELSDGRILAVSNTGLNFIDGDRVVKTIGADEGLNTPQILTLVEDKDGRILAGSDGGGIYVIKDDKVVDNIGKKDGLGTLVVLRIVPYDDGYFYVTSDAIYYDNGNTIKRLDSFPYSNNYDIFVTPDKEAWVSSSAGIYVVNVDELISNGDYRYNLLDYTRGFNTTLTANSWNLSLESGDRLLLCCSDGIREIRTKGYDYVDKDCNIDVEYILCDEEEVIPDEKGLFVLPPTTGRIQIKAAILNFTLSNPTIHIFLEGADDEGRTAFQRGLGQLEYTNLPYGNYKLHIQILNHNDGSVLRDEVFGIYKKPRIMELLFVRILMAVFGALLVAFLVWRVMQSTIIRRQYEEIRLAKDEADRANSAKSRFFANMSHEIRTPINTIMGMDEMILREDTENVPEEYSKSVRGYAKDIKRASELLLGLVNDVLDLSKIESGKMNLVLQDYDTLEFLRALTTMIRVKSNEKDLTFETDIDKELPKKLRGDAGKLKQVVLNLLTNAVKYTEKGGFTLIVRVEERDGNKCLVYFAVRDTGIGVKPEDMEKLFSAFERVDEERNSAVQGTGLGLDISRHFVQLMGGELKCDSVYGEGSTFYFRAEQEILDGEGIGEYTESSPDAGMMRYLPEFIAPEGRVLVVDDNDMNLQVIKGLLKRTKLRLTTVMSGRECLEKLKEQSFHVVLLDHMMPEMDGLQTCAEIRKDFPDLPVIALTANAATSGIEFYREAGFQDYLAKPVEADRIEKTLKKYLPEAILEEPGEDDAGEAGEKLPDDLLWLNDTEGVSVKDGIRFCGGADPFINSIRTFYETLPDNADTIEKARSDGDIEMFTIKVHALKSSARIIGAGELSEMARILEDAGKSGDTACIDENTGPLLRKYREYRDKLKRLSEKNGSDDRDLIPAGELEDAYAALEELISGMDYDAVEMVLSQVEEFRLPDKDSLIFDGLKKRLKVLDWDGMEELLKTGM
ncbi:MAG: response regulator [Lachnospiraceae bacterium]|nr:response regulator [Lachnospiraceae bacterium]